MLENKSAYCVAILQGSVTRSWTNVWKMIPTSWCAGSDVNRATAIRLRDTEMPQPKMPSVRGKTVKNEAVFCSFYVRLVFLTNILFIKNTLLFKGGR